jgi:hypothetical protein
MRITHVKITPGKGVSIAWQLAAGEDWEQHQAHWPEAPLPAFTDAMLKLAPFVIQAKSLGIDPENIDFEVTGVSISYKGETTEKFTVSARFNNQGGNGPECYQTALRTLMAAEPVADQVTPEVRGFVENIKMQAEAYIGGARAQQELKMTADLSEPAAPKAKGKRGRPKKIVQFHAEEESEEKEAF